MRKNKQHWMPSKSDVFIMNIIAIASSIGFTIIHVNNSMLISEIRADRERYNLVTSTPGVAFSTGAATAGVGVAAVLRRILAKMAFYTGEIVFCKMSNFLLHLSQLHSRIAKSGYSTALQVVTRFFIPP